MKSTRGIKIAIGFALMMSGAMIAADATKTPSFFDKFKSGISNTGSSIKSGVKSGTKSVLKTASKVSDIVSPYAESAFAMGQSALNHKNATSMAREDHQRLLEANKLSHQQNLEAIRVQQEHEFKMKQMDLELEKMKLERNPMGTSHLLEQRNQEMRNFDDYMQQYSANNSNEEM